MKPLSITQKLEQVIDDQLLYLAKKKWPDRSPVEQWKACSMPRFYFDTSRENRPLAEDLSDLEARITQAFEEAVGPNGIHQPSWDENYQWFKRQPGMVNDPEPDLPFSNRMRRYGELSRTNSQNAPEFGLATRADTLLEEVAGAFRNDMFKELIGVGIDAADYVDRENYDNDVSYALAVADRAIVGTLDVVELACEISIKLPCAGGGSYMRQITNLSDKYWEAVNT